LNITEGVCSVFFVCAVSLSYTTCSQLLLSTGNWANYKLQDAVRLLDGKGERIN
jgi:hypothetical protein